MNGENATFQKLESVVVAVILGLASSAETHLERHGGQFSMTSQPLRRAYLRCRQRVTARGQEW
jgi:hypothetical protein